ncbi:hypothetical protein OEA42_004018 [Vibrio parahaemolyticus]|uniref:hypothetical protein n=1 Tax=Vibrio vulnificus TaxID=672 RepID=UPI00165D9088|nr:MULTISPECIES: hypothetical protein [Vibrio]EJB0234252.1 hypothetical protein [Vibrio vulnificus]EJX5614676.1 hypothetical protein [Vibrio parahaemolyticus]EKA3724183.1 hypothetical protein [Vibrio vulnificus]ELQ3743178.1 hypothetical protein [Vibrio vulnificus]ELS5841792.1 hypothetical protein [Vibrio vulnificus]
MAQQTSTLTRSNLNSVTSVSPLDHESSPKNDASCSALLLNARRQVRRSHSLSYTVKKVRLTKSLRHSKENAKREAIQELKQSDLFPQIQKLIGEKRLFSYDEIEQLTDAMNRFVVAGWSNVMFGDALRHGLVIFTAYKNISPAMVFQATATGYVLSSFHFHYSTKEA